MIGAPNVGKSTFFNKITNGTAAVSNIDRLTVSDTIAKLKVARHKDFIPIVGYIPIIYVGSVLTLKGKWVINSQFGRQFQVQESEETMPADVARIERYLSSGMIKGLGPKTAKKIVSEVIDAVKNWRELAIRLGQSKREMEMFAGVLERRIKRDE